MQRSLEIAAAFGASAILFGAFGAHGLEKTLSAKQIDQWQTAAIYHLVHSVVLLAIALHPKYSLRLAFALFAGGIVAFSGSIYLLVLTGSKWLGPVTPLGGLALLAGWISIPILLRRRGL